MKMLRAKPHNEWDSQRIAICKSTCMLNSMIFEGQKRGGGVRKNEETGERPQP